MVCLNIGSGWDMFKYFCKLYVSNWEHYLKEIEFNETAGLPLTISAT